MHIVLLGGTGYIGSHVAEQLIKSGHEPLCLVRPNANISFLKSIQATIQTVDFKQLENLKAFINESTTVINCIADTRSHASINQKRPIDIDLPKALFALCQRQNAKQFIQLSTVMAYGFKRHPYAISENQPTEQLHTYNQVANMRDQALQSLWQANSTGLIILRPSNALGKRDVAFLPNFITASHFKVFPVIGHGNWQFSCIDARDIGRAMVHLLSVKTTKPEVFLCKGFDVSWRDLKAVLETALDKNLLLLKLPKPLMRYFAKLLQAITPLGKQPLLTEFDVDVISSHTLYDDSKLQSTGFKPKYNLRDSLASFFN